MKRISESAPPRHILWYSFVWFSDSTFGISFWKTLHQPFKHHMWFTLSHYNAWRCPWSYYRYAISNHSAKNKFEAYFLGQISVIRTVFGSRYFLSQKLWQLHKNIRSCVENEYCRPRTVPISNVNLILKNTSRDQMTSFEMANEIYRKLTALWMLKCPRDCPVGQFNLTKMIQVM